MIGWSLLRALPVVEDYKKWNYKIGKADFINKHRNHPHIDVVVDFIHNNCNSVIEIGPGEMLEYQRVKALRNIDYTIVDVSDTFIANCKQKYPEVHTCQCPMEKLSYNVFNRDFDLVYAASVLEHSQDIRSNIKTLISLAETFHFVMFKWNYEGSLNSAYHRKKKYWSTAFNIYDLMSEIKSYGVIEYSKVAIKSGGSIVDFAEYAKGGQGVVQCGDRLMIHGKRIQIDTKTVA